MCTQRQTKPDFERKRQSKCTDRSGLHSSHIFTCWVNPIWGLAAFLFLESRNCCFLISSLSCSHQDQWDKVSFALLFATRNPYKSRPPTERETRQPLLPMLFKISGLQNATWALEKEKDLPFAKALGPGTEACWAHTSFFVQFYDPGQEDNVLGFQAYWCVKFMCTLVYAAGNFLKTTCESHF